MACAGFSSLSAARPDGVSPLQEGTAEKPALAKEAAPPAGKVSRARVLELVAKLGDKEFDIRMKATAELKVLAEADPEAVADALPKSADDLEVQLRCDEVRSAVAFARALRKFSSDLAEAKETGSGLRILDLVEGGGEISQAGQKVRVHYTGWLLDGKKFDSSLDRGQPFQFTFGRSQVIPGWEEGISSMKVGGKRKLVIPPKLGYGASGAGSIPPNATLVFEVELLEIVKQ